MIEIKKNVPLAPLTTFSAGGPAEYFVEVKSEDELTKALKFADEKSLDIFVLGGGSNILVADQGIKGLVAVNQIMGFESQIQNDSVILKVGAGENWDETVRRAVQGGWGGIECLSGIPGSVGAAPVQNIGAYGQSVDSVIKEVRAVELKTSKVVLFDRDKCEFTYRDSVFKKSPGRWIITGVTFELPLKATSNLSYHDLKKYFEDRSKTPTLEEVREAVIRIRSRKGMVILPGHEVYQSAGSFFKNPIVIVTEEVFIKVKRLVEKEGGVGGCMNPWFWELADGMVKISAACLLEQAGFVKGYREGNVSISPKHSLALINCGGATAKELVGLARKIQDRVLEKFGIIIELEVQLVGFMENPLLTLK